jgi:hypothetical protein
MHTLISHINPETLASPFIYRASTPTDDGTGGLPGKAGKNFAPPKDAKKSKKVAKKPVKKKK